MLNILGLLETDWDLWAQVSVSQKDGEKESSGSTADYMLLVLS